MAIPVILAGLIKAGLPILAGAIASAGKEVVQEKLGINVEELLGTDEGKLRLKQLELDKEEMLQDFILAQREQDIRSDAAYLADVADARHMNWKINTSEYASWLSKNIVPILALIVVIGGGVGIVFSPEPDVRLGLTSVVTLVLGFYFGTTKNSSLKDSTINSLTGSVK